MKKCRIIELGKNNVLCKLKVNYAFVIMSICFILGIIIGAVFSDKSTNVFSVSKWVFNSGFLLYTKSKLLKCFLKVLFCCSLLLAVLFAFGSSVIGVVVVPIFMNVFGIVYGGMFTYVYNHFALKGLAFNAVILLPTTILIVILIIFASKEAFCLSLSVANLTVKNTLTNNLFFHFKTVCFKYLIFY